MVLAVPIATRSTTRQPHTPTATTAIISMATVDLITEDKIGLIVI
jgi:hypothetical protein